MPGSVIGKSLNLGYPGSISRSADAIIANRLFRATDTGTIPFGSPVVLNPDNTYSAFGSVASTLAAALTLSTAYTTLTVAALPNAVDVGDLVTLVSGADNQTTTVAVAAAAGATTLTVASFTANFAYPIGTTVTISNTFAQFAGVAAREVKQSTDYFAAQGEYLPGQPCDVIERGSVTVTCNVGTPVAGGAVYVRIAANAGIPTGVVGGFEAAADGTNTIQLTNVMWKTGKIDANKVAEVTILTRVNP